VKEILTHFEDDSLSVSNSYMSVALKFDFCLVLHNICSTLQGNLNDLWVMMTSVWLQW